MLIACGTRTLTRQYYTEEGAGVVEGVAERIVTGGPSATSVTDPMPALLHAVTGEAASACGPNSDAIAAPVAINSFTPGVAAPLRLRQHVSIDSSISEFSAREPPGPTRRPPMLLCFLPVRSPFGPG